MEKFIAVNSGVTMKAYSFPCFKEYLIREFSQQLQHCFLCFLNLLNDRNEQAWKVVFNDLERLSAAWFFNRHIPLNPDIHAVFSEAFEIMYIKFSENKLVFKDSRDFKSYFFKILENKRFEACKQNAKSQRFSPDLSESLQISNPECEQIFEAKERQQLIQVALSKLKDAERAVLTAYFYSGKKLKDIASESGQTEENIRIQKHRALKKLGKHLKSKRDGS